MVREEINVFYQIQCRGPLDVVDDPAALCHHFGHGGKIAVQQYQLGHLTGRVCAGGHGHAAVGVFQRQNIVDAVACHGHRAALALEGADNFSLLVGHHTAKDSVLPDGPGDIGVGLQLPGVDPALRALNACLFGNGGDRDRIVA